MTSRDRWLINARDASLHFRLAHHLEVQPATIRQWASRGRIGSYGHGRERYDLREIEAYATTIGLIPRPGGA